MFWFILELLDAYLLPRSVKFEKMKLENVEILIRSCVGESFWCEGVLPYSGKLRVLFDGWKVTGGSEKSSESCGAQVELGFNGAQVFWLFLAQISSGGSHGQRREPGD